MYALEVIQAMNAEAMAKAQPEAERPLRTGDEVTANGARGVVVDGHVAKSGPNKGKVEVIWIGGRYTTAELPAELKRVQK